MTKQRTKSNKSLWVLLGGALLLRLVLALVTDGYPYDMSCFVAWGDKLAAGGPAAFYSEGYFADYPPGYLWVLGLVGAIRARCTSPTSPSGRIFCWRSCRRSVTAGWRGSSTERQSAAAGA